jgi:Cft2 family RNA processing exonuclease
LTVRLSVLSGLGPKQAAAFLVETGGAKLLLDLGEESGTRRRPDLGAAGRVDAVILSHAHRDHCGALDLLDRIGDPPVHATASVLSRLGLQVDGRALPPHGTATVAGVSVQTGRSGHALGGIWVRVDVDGGLLYMGDHSDESEVFAFDPPPPSATIILDASYGTAEETRAAQQSDVLAATKGDGPVLFPVPPDGRGIEIALFLHRAGRRVALDDAVRGTLRRIAETDCAFARPGQAELARALADSAPEAIDASTEPDAILAAEASADDGVAAKLLGRGGNAARLRTMFTGHLPEASRGAQMVARGAASLRRWNAHPTLKQNVDLAASVGAATVVPAFGDSSHLPAWRSAFAPSAVYEASTG